MKQYKLSVNVKKHLDAGTLLLGAVGYALIAGVIWLRPSFAAGAFLYAMAALLTIMGVSNVAEGLSRPAGGWLKLTLGCANLALAALALLQSELFLSFFPVVLGLYLLLTAALHFITFYLQYRERAAGAKRLLVLSIMSLGFGLTFVLRPAAHLETLRLLMALYFALMSLNSALDLWREVDPGKLPVADAIKRRIRIQLPAGLTALVPRSAIDKVNESLRLSAEMGMEQDLFKDPDAVPDIEIFIHVTRKGRGMVGHVDLCYNDSIMSFGSYDEASFRFKGLISSGVLAVINGKERYLDFCIGYSNKSIFGFGLRLTEGQRGQIELRIEDIMRSVDSWPSPAQRDGDVGQTDYASVLWRQLNARLYKFRAGGFRTYFVAGTNCALLADRVVGVLGTDVLPLNGILTPGAYYSYLDREFRRKNSAVITKRLYKEQEDGE